MKSNTKRALIRTGFVAFGISIYLGVYLHYKNMDHGSGHPVGQVREFLLEKPNKEYFTHFALKNNVSLIFVAGENKREEEAQLDEFENYLQDRYKGILKFVVTKNSFNLPSTSWEEIIENAENENDIQHLLGNMKDVTNKLLVVDQNLLIRGVFPLTKEKYEEIRSVLSIFVFDHSMTDYLSKRTFFGPKRMLKQ